MTHPYQRLEAPAFWRSAVAEAGPFGLSELWTPKFPVQPDHTIVTAGSCFAQHLGRALVKRGYGWTDFEPAPPWLMGNLARQFGYGVFSARTGNIYTPTMLLQWLRLAFEEDPQPEEVWHSDGRYFDPLRPAIEPDGFDSPEEVLAARVATCAALRRAVESTDIFVFTLGLTECWYNLQTGLEYALCPGTVAGTFDKSLHGFGNGNTRSVSRDLNEAIARLKQHNPDIRVLLTVSPVPLTATASGNHVMTATTYSKSVLRAVAGMTAEEKKFVDYFPSYEIITHPVFRGMFFAPNMRSVVPEGVNTVMRHFFADQARVFGVQTPSAAPAQTLSQAEDMDVKCEEELLDAFAA